MAKRGKDALKSKTPSLALAKSSVRMRTLTQSPTQGRRSSPSGGSSANPSPRRARLPRTRVGHLLRKSSQPTKHKAQQRAWQLDTNFDAWRCKKIAKGITGWATRDTMICDLAKHRKVQPNHPDPVGLPLDYMGKCQVFDGIRSDIYDLCRFYILGMTGDPPEFPAPSGTSNPWADQRSAKVGPCHWPALHDPGTQC